ncbi:uncharacterized protein LOC126373381 [Pectinophora gossypiella]|uniref:uncharacterized protein LOC126373381 n=1 Tax=Pectinophora gossypiella TaxID=13191 RepID=UPI00214F4E8D|nr:uncharacterized protein LOC126373381 [Pectinophora gossypiella]
MTNKMCCSSCSVETGSLVFAIFSCVLFCIASLLGIGITLYSVYVHISSVVHSRTTFFGPFAPFTMILLTTLAIITFVFTSILWWGVHKRKAEYVKIYFGYGIVVLVLCLASSVSFSMFFWQDEGDGGETFFRISSVVMIFVSLLFSLALVMIRATYKKFEQQSTPYNNQYRHTELLDEKC